MHVNRLKETNMGVVQVFTAEKETMLQHRPYDGVSLLMGTSFRGKKILALCPKTL